MKAIVRLSNGKTVELDDDGYRVYGRYLEKDSYESKVVFDYKHSDFEDAHLVVELLMDLAGANLL